VSFGMQKFTLQSAQGIVQCISNSPFISWLSVFGLRIAETTVITHRNQRRLRPHWRGEPPRTAARLA
jgi:uncharacterized membrane protein YkgB